MRLRDVNRRVGPCWSRPDEILDEDPGENGQGNAADENVADIISRRAPSHGRLVLFGYNWTFVRIHRTLLPWECGDSNFAGGKSRQWRNPDSDCRREGVPSREKLGTVESFQAERARLARVQVFG